MRRVLSSSILALACAIANPVLAQEHHDTDHENADQDIVVSGHPPIDFGLLQSAATLEGDELTAAARGQIGDTLAALPGVSATSFAPGASRPVLRGFDGDRIRVLVDGIGSIDASSVSVDHAVVFDPLTVDHVDVLHGPATLLFGGQAIGGAVNALDKRIPRRVPGAITVTALAGYGSASEERSAGGAIDLPFGDRFVVHFDASWRTSDDVRVGGFVNSPALREALLDEAAVHRGAGELEQAAEFEELAELSGRIANSAARSYTLGAGVAFIDAGGDIGVSVQRFDTRYGIPARPGAGHAHRESGEEGEAPVTIDLVQTRVDLRGTLQFDGWIDSLQIRGAFGDYTHIEFEGDEVGTTFHGKGIEFRADLIQSERDGWRGRSGFQILTRKLAAIGPEAIFPLHTVDRLGLFTLQSLRLGAIELEAAGRYERATVRATTIGFERNFDLWSGAAGLSWTPLDGLKLGANYVRGARAPAPEELLSDGLHVATQAFELGNPDFAVETSDGFELYARYRGDGIELSLTGYLTDFGNFIAAVPTGAVLAGFPEFAYAQLPARFKGFEASAKWDALSWDGGKLVLDAAADFTHAELKTIGPVPRIPPLRLRGGAELELGALHLHGEVEWNDRQERVAAFENAVPGVTLVNLSADWHPLGEDGPLTVILAVDNLLDVEARRAASFTRDYVPLPGRDIRLTVKLSY